MARKIKKSWYTRKKLIYRLLSLMAFFILLGGVYEAVQLVQLHLEGKNIKEEIEQIDQGNREREEIRDGLVNDPRVIEKMAREELGLIKEGDRVFRIIRPDSQKETVDDGQSDRVDTQK
jgi:cell division protein FtsB